MPNLGLSYSQDAAASSRRRGGFTLVETLMVLLVAGLMISIMMGARGLFSSGREAAAAQELASVLESARAQAMRGVGDVLVAFAVSGDLASHRRYALCEELEVDKSIRPTTAWRMLPPGCVLTNCLPATNAAGRNLLTLQLASQRVEALTEDGGQMLNCVCLRFGARGQLLSPDTDGSPLLLALAQGDSTGAGPEALDGSRHSPEQCLWVSVQPATGKVSLLQ